MKRLLDCTSSDFKKMNGQELKQAIKASEGRVILAEVIPSFAPLYREITNAELAGAFGADLILLNLVDVFAPTVLGIPENDNDHHNVVSTLKNLTGRPIGVNLEPVDPKARALEALDQLPEGRIASPKTVGKALDLGFDFICLTGNPKSGVTNEEIIQAIKNTKKVTGDELLIIAGKMHGAGVQDTPFDEAVKEFASAGADVILLPSPGTVPGISVENVQKWVTYIHDEKALAMLTIGTSQEGAQPEVIQQMALNNKMAGADIHHIGDAGFTGIAVPENIMTYSITVRGKRHTYIRMASSIRR